MIENISTLVSNSKVINSLRSRHNIKNVTPSEESIETAKAKVQAIIDAGKKKKRKKKTTKSQDET